MRMSREDSYNVCAYIYIVMSQGHRMLADPQQVGAERNSSKYKVSVACP